MKYKIKNTTVIYTKKDGVHYLHFTNGLLFRSGRDYDAVMFGVK